ncbi:class I SAM-dependent methyltransferase [Chloroflexota bacterium]
MTELQEVKKVLGGGMMLPDDKVDLWTVRDHLARYAFSAELIRDKVVLDLACGSGYGSALLLDKGARMVVGGDIFVKAIAAAKVYFAKPGVEFLVANATALPFADNSFEAIVSMETIEHVEQYKTYLNECRRILKEGGIFICSTPYKWQSLPEATVRSPYHVHEFYLNEFQDLLLQFFSETEFYGQHRLSKMERTIETITHKAKEAMRPLIVHTPQLYELIRLFYKYVITVPYTKMFYRYPHTQLSQIRDWDKLLDENYKPYPLDNSSLTPKIIIAVARK